MIVEDRNISLDNDCFLFECNRSKIHAEGAVFIVRKLTFISYIFTFLLQRWKMRQIGIQQHECLLSIKIMKIFIILHKIYYRLKYSLQKQFPLKYLIIRLNSNKNNNNNNKQQQINKQNQQTVFQLPKISNKIKIMKQKNIHINPEDIKNNPINNSTSKMLYSFSKDKRFHTEVKLDTPFYTLPDIKEKRSASLGIGKRTKFEDYREIPPPNTYSISSQFERTRSNIGFSFGVGRDQLKADSVVMFKPSASPGPGTYDPKLSKNCRTISIKSRTKDHSLDQKKKIPGPGTYSVLVNTASGKAISSKFINSGSPVISQNVYQKQKRNNLRQYPAPWSYNPVIITRKGEKSVSKGNAAKFSLSRRQGFIEYNKNPGPGQYNYFSQFTK